METRLAGFAALLRHHRARLGMTQADLAHQSGVTLATIKQYETGRCDPSLGKVAALTSALGINPLEAWDTYQSGQYDAGASCFAEAEGDHDTARAAPLTDLEKTVRQYGIRSKYLPAAIEITHAWLRSLDVTQLETLVLELSLPFKWLEREQADIGETERLLRILVVAGGIYRGTPLLSTLLQDASSLEAFVKKLGAYAKTHLPTFQGFYSKSIFETPEDVSFRWRKESLETLVSLALARRAFEPQKRDGQQRISLQDAS